MNERTCPPGEPDPWCPVHPFTIRTEPATPGEARPDDDPWHPTCNGHNCGGYPHE